MSMIFILIGALTCIFSRSAFAECRLSFNGLDANQDITLDAETIHKIPLRKTITFTVKNNGPSDCYYFTTINEGSNGNISYNRQAKIAKSLSSLSASRDSISYQIYAQTVLPSNIVRSLDHAVFEQNVLGPRLIRSGQTVSESFIVHVPAQTIPNLIAESYQDDLILSLYQSPSSFVDFVHDCPKCIEEEQQPLNIQFGITNYVTLSIGNSYSPNAKSSLLDFGELETNKEESFEIYVGGRSESSSACSISISSENGSKLVRKDATDKAKANEKIKYSVRARSDIGAPIVSTDIDLSTPNTHANLATSSVPFICGNNNKGMMGVKVYIKIDDTNKRKSGIYRDTITIEAKIGL